MCCLKKIQNNSPHKYIVYDLVYDYLDIIGSGSQLIKSRDSMLIEFSVNVASVLVFSIILLLHKTFVDNFQYT